ncbi:MAG: altronate dehydratase family protein [bacterium]|nr:altronate dehydratase family protein [bacterium]
MKQILKIHPADNVAVILTDNNPVAPRGHKIALRGVAKGEPVVKYGFPIGRATQDISEGEWVHSHNLATALGANEEYTYNPSRNTPAVKTEPLTINGYLRSNGEIGIRNELWIVPTVGCVNGQANAIVERLRQEVDLTGIDDVRAFTHNYGCSQLGQDHANTRAALAALVRHPNAGGVLVLGLGCENNQMNRFREEIGAVDADRVKFLVAQDVEDEVETGFELCRDIIERMRADRREPLPISRLKVGLKCGGSDGFSGITANPLVGRISDRLVSMGGTTVLTEVPEMFGAETILMDRAESRDVFDRIVGMITDFKDYFRSFGMPVYENPSPGNKAGGITTLEEKSLGCVQKGGTSAVVDVLAYNCRATKPGLNLLTAPGNDLVAATALALSGCHMVLFTTGRGTPFGTCVPTMKISTNSQLASRKRNWVDFDAGILLENGDMEGVADSLMAKIVETANGSRLKHELAGAKEIAIFKSGVTL